ncbi:MAG TPA: TadE/TadG family type IV pilus assembly protein [Caulobacteraceae bacterium]|jgi:Flp pilus assembly protein TadG|nr:TadE/TadG family type IV pilus assembly protein [Caulobacteraceae bacterium]
MATRFSAFLREARGAAAAEFTLVALMFAYMMINVGDVGVYVYDKMQVESAAQAAAESVWAQCSPTTNGAPGVTFNCSNYTSMITSSAQNTSLGTAVIASVPASPGEGWYCSSKAGSPTLSLVKSIAAKADATPTPTCATILATDLTNAGDYLPVQASYTYSPIFPGATVTSLLSKTITQTVWIRVY